MADSALSTKLESASYSVPLLREISFPFGRLAEKLIKSFPPSFPWKAWEIPRELIRKAGKRKESQKESKNYSRKGRIDSGLPPEKTKKLVKAGKRFPWKAKNIAFRRRKIISSGKLESPAEKIIN
jgi:hypothetical protein